MTTKGEAFRAVLSALQSLEGIGKFPNEVPAIAASREALAQKDEQEPNEVVYAFRRKGLDDFCTCDERRYKELSEKPNLFETVVFYTAPPKRKPLTEDEIMRIGRELGKKCKLGGNPNIDIDYARAVEQAHGIGVEHDAP